jgi:hypothetical protein
LDEGMETKSQLNTTWISINLQLPCASSKFHSHDSSRFFHFCLQQFLNYTYRRRLAQEKVERMMKFDWKSEKSLRSNWENLENFGFGSEKMNCGSRFSVMINAS